MKFNNTLYKLVLFFVLIIVLSVIFAYFSILSTPIDCSKNHKLIIYKNENAYDIGHRLDSLGIVDNYYSFILVAKLLSIDRLLKPGHYDLTYIKDMRQLVHRLTIANRDYIKITIPEGWTIDQIAEKLEYKGLINAEKFKRLCSNKFFINSVGFNNLNSLEGYLFPETYFLSEHQFEEEIIRMMLDALTKPLLLR